MKTPTLHLPARRLAAATLALAMAGGAVLASHPAHAAPGPHGGAGMHGGMGGMGGMMGSPRHLERLLDEVGASADQKSQIKAIMDTARKDLQALHEAGRPLMQQQMELFAQPTVDARAAEALRQQMLARHDKASQRMMQAMLDASRVLTPEQRQKIATRMNERRSMMERRMRDGRGASGPTS